MNILKKYLGDKIEISLTCEFNKKGYDLSMSIFKLSNSKEYGYFIFKNKEDWVSCKNIIGELFYGQSEYEHVVDSLKKMETPDIHFNKDNILNYITISEFSQFFLRPLALYIEGDKIVDGIYMYRVNNEEDLPLVGDALSSTFKSLFLANYHIKKMISFKKEQTGLSMFLAFCETITSKLSDANRKFTYIMTDSTGLYKIGKSIDPIKRQKQLKNSNILIELYCYIEGDRELELHRIFHSKRVDGEWFRLSNKDLKFIRNYNKIRKEHPEYII